MQTTNNIHDEKNNFEVKSVFSMHYADGTSEALTDTSYGYFETIQEAQACINFAKMFNDTLNSEGSKISFWIKPIN